MSIAYINCSRGVSGDMLLSALIDAGLNPSAFAGTLKKRLNIGDFRLTVRTTNRYHFPAKTLRVEGNIKFDTPLKLISALNRSSLPGEVKSNALAAMRSLAAAEASVHRRPVDGTHFHQLADIDTLVDISGVCLALQLLGIKRLFASEVNLGRPAPAAIELAKAMKVPVFSDDSNHELATPTGMALIGSLCLNFGAMPSLIVTKSGFGAGENDIDGKPNVLNILVGEPGAAGDKYDFRQEEIAVLETNIDDMDPRIYPYVSEQLLKAGAKDVWLEQIMMKKGRPGTKIGVLCDTKDEAKMASILFDETTTIGVRSLPAKRYLLNRSTDGSRKTIFMPGGTKKIRIEFEEAKRKALKHGLPLKRVIKQA